jgi:hypothetical protein
VSKIAVVGLNSLYACGATSFMLHLTSNSDWDLIIYSEKRSDNDLVPPKSFKGIIGVNNGKDLCKILKEYDKIIFAAPKWGGDYSFLDSLRPYTYPFPFVVGIVIHDTNDFIRMGMEELIFRFPFAKLLCFDNTVLYHLSDLHTKNICRVIKHPYDTMMVCPDRDSVCHDSNEYMVCATRFTPSKNIKHVVECAGEHRLKIYGVDSGNEVDANFCKNKKNIDLHYGRYSFEEIAGAYLGAKASLDGSKLSSPVKRTQYSFMDSWRYHVPVLCDKDWMGDELINGVNCLKLSVKNVDEIWKDGGVALDIAVNGHITLVENHDPEDVRNDILSILDIK